MSVGGTLGAISYSLEMFGVLWFDGERSLMVLHRMVSGEDLRSFGDKERLAVLLVSLCWVGVVSRTRGIVVT